MRRILLLLFAAAVLAAPVALAKGAFPKTIRLPNGFQPEGIAIKGNTFYVGSIPTGAVYAGNLRTGEGAVLVPGAAGHAATGLKVDRGRLFVSGAGPERRSSTTRRRAGSSRVQLATGGGPTFINDVVVTKKAAYFTDSNRAVIYKVPIGGKAPGDLRRSR